MVPTLMGTCIDRYEWPNQAGVRPTLGLSAIPEAEDRRQGRVMDAAALCKSVGKRVCTADEWISACEGPKALKYPFGDKLPKYRLDEGDGLCNYDKRYREVDEYGVQMRAPAVMSKLNQSEPAGARKTCVSPMGAYDMVGNAEEWVRCEDGLDGWCLASRFWAEPRSCRAMVRNHSGRWHYYNTSTRCCTEQAER